MKVRRLEMIGMFCLLTGAVHANIQDTTHTVWNLKACLHYALEQNIQIKQSRLAQEEAAINTQTAKADLFPSLSFATSHNLINHPFSEQSNIVDGTNIINTNHKTNYTGSYGLNAQWILYNGSKRLNTLKQSKQNQQIANLELQAQENDIQEQILQAYLQILYASEAVKINENTLAVSEATCERGNQLLQAGSIAQSDMAQLEAQRSADNYQLVLSKSTLESYKLQLKQLLELDADNEMMISLPSINDTDVIQPLPTRLEVYQAALTHRPEIQANRLNIEVSELDIAIAKAGHHPTISLSAGIGTNHTSGTDFTFSEQIKNGWNNSIGINISIPIFNNRETKSSIQNAKLAQRSAVLSLLEKEKTLYKTIESLWLETTNAQQNFLAARKKLESATISFELAKEEFAVGMKNTVELLTEKNNWLNAQQEVLQAKFLAVLNAELLRFYTGKETYLE